ncbi:AMP-binding protein [Gimibacter soli]|uniref:3-methylmercaptopropionyl-CoA ligase n=1 Tax=Gimibacter soli TaxID=3024400 RepID=A0AAE9XNR1_9PROT|nr:AMP-binding protein [Gimibacter soli]WCL53407.1 AMP-binding protein [Gimibacter soli]
MRETKSYVCGTSDTPLQYRTIGEALDETVRRFGERDALVSRHQGIRWNWKTFAAEVDKVAAGLCAMGLRKGDRVGIWSPNNAEWILTQFATARLGVILVNINPAYRLSELDYALNKAGCRGLVIADRFKASDYVDMIRTLAPEIADCPKGKLRSGAIPNLEWVAVIGAKVTGGFLAFADIAGAGSQTDLAALPAIAATLSPDDPINIQFTSGTTGSPKGATLTHHNILNNGYFVGARQDLSEADRLCIPVPLYHCFGMVMGVLGCLTHGACMVLPGDSFDPVAVLQAVAAEKCTALYGVPTMFIAILDHPDFDTFDLSILRTGVMAGSPCPVEVMKKVISRMHMAEVTICYGMTETSPVSFQSTTDDPLDKRVGTVGQVHPYVEIMIIDEAGCPVPRGVQGELCTRGYSVMRGYWDDEAQTREAIDAAGWMHTGDLATMDREGYVNITGRLKDMIIRGGENIYPREIEEYLYRHEDIQDVQVFGVPDAKYGEEICAWVVLREGARMDEAILKAFCKGQIAHYKVPRYVRFVDTFPMTVTGKIQKFVMRSTMADELKIREQTTA